MVELQLGQWWVVVDGSGFGSMIWTRIVRVVEFLLGLWWVVAEGSGIGSIIWPSVSRAVEFQLSLWWAFAEGYGCGWHDRPGGFAVRKWKWPSQTTGQPGPVFPGVWHTVHTPVNSVGK